MKSLRYRLSQLLIHAAAFLVPRWRREQWRREWSAEIWHHHTRGDTPDPGASPSRSPLPSTPATPAPHSPLPSNAATPAPRSADVLTRALGSLRHALWLRTREWKRDMLALDLRYAVRNLLRTPGFTFIAIATLTIGIGTSTAVFSLVNGVLLQPYPYAEPDRLVRVGSVDLESGRTANLSFPDYVDLASAATIETIAAVDREPYNLGGGDTAVYVQGAQVTANLFDLLGTPFLQGRGFSADADRPGAPDVVVLGEAVWRGNFGADPDIVGRQVTIDAEPYTVLGVVPMGGGYPDEAGLWVPLRIDSGAQQRGSRWANVIARLAPGASLAQARAEAIALAATLAQEYPESNEGVGLRLVELYESRTADMRGLMLLMLGAVGFVLLIVCANVAGLSLSRAATRERELAVRAAMGASRLRIVRQLVTESALLALAGGALGTLLASWAVTSLTAMIPIAIPEWIDFGLDLRVVAFAVGAAALATVISGLAPAWHAGSADLNRTLKESTPAGGSRGKQRARAALVVGEVALSVVLLVGAGLMVRSLLQVSAIDTGFATEDTFMLTTAFSDADYGEPEQRLAFYRRARQELLSVPGVVAVGGIAQPPLRGGWNYSGFQIEGREAGAGNEPAALIHAVTPGYIDAAGIPLLRGRDLRDADGRPDSPQAALVSSLLAERYWPGEDPLGRRFRFPFMDEGVWIEVVGLVADTTHVDLEEERAPEIFYPYERWSAFYNRMTWMVRTDGDPAAVMPVARAGIQRLDPNQAIYDLMTMRAAVNQSIWQVRFFTLLFWIFGAIAIVLAAVGLYGLIAYTVSQRTHEIGVRMAMGAHQRNVLTMVLRHGLLLAAIGGIFGFAGALALANLLASDLYQVSPLEPTVYLAVAVVLLVVAAVASYVPAARATRVDPLVALRDDA